MKPLSSPSPSWKTVIGRNLEGIFFFFKRREERDTKSGKDDKLDYRRFMFFLPQVCSLPAKYQVSIKAASVHASILRVQHPAPQAGGEVWRRLPPLLRLGAAVGGVKRKGGAGGDGVGAAGVLLPQVLGDDAVEGRGGGEVALQLLLHGWSLNQREEKWS